MATTYRYLALGDSYTIGEAVEPEKNFPFQLKDRLAGQNWHCEELKIVAKTGWTTAELQEGIARAKPKGPYDLVTLLIGVNNQYRRYERSLYPPEFKQLLDQAIAFAGGRTERVIVVSIPDYGVTPFGKEMADQIYEDLLWYNGEASRLAHEKGVAFVDIFEISREAAGNPALLAHDQLHPSEHMYRKWVEAIYPVALSKLN